MESTYSITPVFLDVYKSILNYELVQNQHTFVCFLFKKCNWVFTGVRDVPVAFKTSERGSCGEHPA